MKNCYVYRASDCAIYTDTGFQVTDMRFAKFMTFTEVTSFVKSNPGTV